MRLRFGLYLVLLSAYLSTASGHFFSTDHISVFLTTQSLLDRGDLSIKPINDAVPGREGRYYSPFGLGQSLAIVPFYLAGRMVDRVASPDVRAYFSGMPLGDWGGTVQIFFVSLLNQFLVPALCLLFFEFSRELGFRTGASLGSTLIFGLSTSAWVYARDSFQHPLEAMSLLLTVYILFSRRERLCERHLLAAGGCLSLGVLTRINLITTVPVIALYSAWLAWQRGAGSEGRGPGQTRRDMADALVLFVGPIVVTLLAMMFLNDLRYGRPLAFHTPGQAKGLSTPLWLGLYGNLFSVGRSVFLYSPPILLGLATLRALSRRFRAEAVLLVALCLTYLTLYSTYGEWDGGWCYGPRFLFPVVMLMMLPVGAVFSDRRLLLVAAALVVAGLAVQIPGVSINVGFVYSEWMSAKLVPPNAFLFAPDISAIPTHWRDLLAGRQIDLWLVEVYHRFGLLIALLTAAVPVGLMASGLALLHGGLRTDSADRTNSEMLFASGDSETGSHR